MSSPHGNGKPAGLWTWLARNDFRALRFIFAVTVFFLIVIPLTRKGEELITRDYSELGQKTKTITEPSIRPPSQEFGSNVTEERDKPIRSNEPIAIRSETEVVSASPRVWVYGLQLAAWIGALGASLWALVALCRDE